MKAIADNYGGGYKVTPRVKGSIQPLRDNIIVEEMKFGMQTTSKGLIVLNDDGANHGIKPRWGKVYAIGPDQTDIRVGQYILVEHGRWSRGVELVDPVTGEEKTIRLVDNNNILLVSDEPVDEVMIGKLTGA
jgi:co-chaperonin GroES (HSP10)